MKNNIEKDELTKSVVIKVNFMSPINGKKEYFFGSLSAIYNVFSDAEIGCKIDTLWNSRITVDNPKATRKCFISKVEVLRKKQKKVR